MNEKGMLERGWSVLQTEDADGERPLKLERPTEEITAERGKETGGRRV